MTDNDVTQHGSQHHSSTRGHVGNLPLAYPGHAPSDHRHRAGSEGSIPVHVLLGIPGGTITSKSRFERLTGVWDSATVVLFHRRRDLAYPESS